MVSFRLAAIRILKEAGGPLHPEEITKRALEQKLIETSGATPELTMHALLATDIKVKKDKSPFIRKAPARFALNPSYKEAEKEEEEKEEVTTREESERISNQFVGKAGEHLVVSELLFQGFNASIMPVDEGVDVVATKDDKIFNIQVKTSNENKFNSYVADMTISSFEKHNKSNSFTIFVLRGKNTTFVVLPYVVIEQHIHDENVLLVNKKTRYRFNIKIRDGKVYLGNRQNDVSFYADNWKLIR
ncbi:winged helix-turn-helix domain-containing protein [Nitrososphaera sp.]|uniref:winged helix-turn-helix domain-containing protein n=1 Tax=Nitrososphaera sp. TaxID=1971748 RepID=UPI00317F9863